MKIASCNNIMDFRRIAQRRLPSPVFNYLDGGADDEWTLERNTTAFDDYELLPAQLSDVSNLNLKTTLFGEPVDWPLMISPTGASRLFHASGEPAVVRAAEKFGMFYSLSTLSTTSIEDVAAVGNGPKRYSNRRRLSQCSQRRCYCSNVIESWRTAARIGACASRLYY